MKTQQWRLLGGNLLYDIKADPSQTTNLADKFPQVVSDLSIAYEVFWNSLPHQDSLLSRHVIGAPEAQMTRLNGMDWYRGGSPWHQLHLNRQHQNGVWAVTVARSGRYRFELRWYPREAQTGIGMIGASIRVGKEYAYVDVAPEEPKVVLELELEQGDYDMETAFTLPPVVGEGRSWGAYFVHVDFVGKE